jgi:hypothetical protein
MDCEENMMAIPSINHDITNMCAITLIVTTL